jgi:hypothetical protein
MKTLPPPLPIRRAAAFRWWHGLLGLFLCGLVAVALLAWSLLAPWREVRALRDTLGAATGGAGTTRVQVSVGALPLALVRLVAGLLPLPPEARPALDAVRGISVGVYQAPQAGPVSAKWLEAADRRMTDQGWERVVGVVDGAEVVGVYVPRDLAGAHRMSVAVFVRSGEDLVVVSARGNLDPLIELARAKLGQSGSPFLAGVWAGQ